MGGALLTLSGVVATAPHCGAEAQHALGGPEQGPCILRGWAYGSRGLSAKGGIREEGRRLRSMGVDGFQERMWQGGGAGDGWVQVSCDYTVQKDFSTTKHFSLSQGTVIALFYPSSDRFPLGNISARPAEELPLSGCLWLSSALCPSALLGGICHRVSLPGALSRPASSAKGEEK